MKLELIVDDGNCTIHEFDLSGITIHSCYFHGNFGLITGRLQTPLEDAEYDKFCEDLEQKLAVASDVEVTVEGNGIEPENYFDVTFSYEGDCDENLAWSFDFE